MHISQISLVALISISLSLTSSCLSLNPVTLLLVASAVAQTTEEQTVEADRLLKQGLQQFQSNQVQAAFQSVQSALRIYQKIGNQLNEATSLFALGRISGSLAQYTQALDFYQQALTIYKTIGDHKGESTTLNNIGLIYQSLKQYSRALEQHRQALAIAQEIGYQAAEGVILSDIGAAYQALEQYSQALEYYEQALEIAQIRGNQNGQVIILSSTATVYQLESEYSQALEKFQAALEIAREIGDRSKERNILNNIGDLYQLLGKHTEALEYHKQSLAISQEIGSQVSNLIGHYSNSLTQTEQALTTVQEISNRLGEGARLNDIGYTFSEQGEDELAIIFLKQAVNNWQQIREELRALPAAEQQSFRDTVTSSYRKLADLLLQQNRVLEAQQVLDLLKIQELEGYLHNVDRNGETGTSIEVLRPEQELITQHEPFQENAIKLGQELAALNQRRIAGTLTVSEEQRRLQLSQLQEEANQQFNNFIHSPEIVGLIQQLSPQALRQSLPLEDIAGLQDNLQNLNAALLYPLILDDRLELVVSLPNAPAPLRRTVNLSKDELIQTIMEFRQALQNPHLDAKASAQKLYKWLISPIQADLEPIRKPLILWETCSGCI